MGWRRKSRYSARWYASVSLLVGKQDLILDYIRNNSQYTIYIHHRTINQILMKFS